MRQSQDKAAARPAPATGPGSPGSLPSAFRPRRMRVSPETPLWGRAGERGGWETSPAAPCALTPSHSGCFRSGVAPGRAAQPAAKTLSFIANKGQAQPRKSCRALGHAGSSSPRGTSSLRSPRGISLGAPLGPTRSAWRCCSARSLCTSASRGRRLQPAGQREEGFVPPERGPSSGQRDRPRAGRMKSSLCRRPYLPAAGGAQDGALNTAPLPPAGSARGSRGPKMHPMGVEGQRDCPWARPERSRVLLALGLGHGEAKGMRSSSQASSPCLSCSHPCSHPGPSILREPFPVTQPPS